MDRRKALQAMLCAVPAVAGICISDTSTPDVTRLAYAETPPSGTQTGVVLELPPEMRTKNWGGGSCVHASNVNLLKWMGLDDLADWWRKQYIGGEYSDRLIKRMEAAGLRYAFTTSGDEKFLRWCFRTRRGAGIFYKPQHSINAVGEDENYVFLLDNNATNYPERNGHYERVVTESFFQRWRSQFGGFAWTLVYSPAPPVPTV